MTRGGWSCCCARGCRRAPRDRDGLPGEIRAHFRSSAARGWWWRSSPPRGFPGRLPRYRPLRSPQSCRTGSARRFRRGSRASWHRCRAARPAPCAALRHCRRAAQARRPSPGCGSCRWVCPSCRSCAHCSVLIAQIALRRPPTIGASDRLTVKGTLMFDWLKRSSGTPHTAGSRPHSYVSNTIALIDTSYSVGQDMVDFAVSKGIPAIAESMRKASTRNGIQYNLGIMTFATEVKTVVPLTDVRDLDVKKSLPKLTASGVTMMEDAMWKALAEIDRAKAQQDKEGIARAGSLIICVTDGYPTDSEGDRKDLSNYLVRELASRNRTRSCETFAIGMGKVDVP